MQKSHRQKKKAARDKKRACGQFILHIHYIILDGVKSFLLKDENCNEAAVDLAHWHTSHN